MIAYLWLLKYGIPFLIGAVVFGGAAWKIQGVRLSVAKADFATCSIANQTNTETIEQLKKQAENFNKTCQERLASKDRTINAMRGIDELKPKMDNAGKPASDDPILNRLNRMFGNK